MYKFNISSYIITLFLVIEIMENDFKITVDELLESNSQVELLNLKNGICSDSNSNDNTKELISFSADSINLYDSFINILSSKDHLKYNLYYKKEDLYYGSYFIGNSAEGINKTLKNVFCLFLENDFLNMKLTELPYFQDVSYGLSCINVNKLNNLLAIIDPDSGEIYSYYRKELYKAIRINKKYITEIETIAVIYDVMAEIAQKYTNRYKKATIDDYNKVLTV